MTKTKQTPEETAADIKHAVNVLITRARDGEYSSAASEKLYRTFDTELDILTAHAMRAASASELEQAQTAMIETMRLAIDQNCRQLVRLHSALTAACDYCLETTGEPPEQTWTWWTWWMSKAQDRAGDCAKLAAEQAEAGIDV